MTLIREKAGAVTFKGNPVTLLGDDILVGSEAPEFRVVDNAFNPVNLKDSAGKIRLIVSVPSLDTGPCDLTARTFTEKAAQLPDDVVIYTISMDLPPAQKRWCGNAGIEKVQTLSDFQDRSFGLGYGLLIKELKLLARSVFVIDPHGKVVYREIVPEVSEQPDFDAALQAVKKFL